MLEFYPFFIGIINNFERLPKKDILKISITCKIRIRRLQIILVSKNLYNTSDKSVLVGIWADVPKPFQYTDLQKQRFGVVESEGLADRKVPKQPNIFHGKETDRYNCRKINELPYHLLRSKRLEELYSLCLFNYEFLQAKVL